MKSKPYITIAFVLFLFLPLQNSYSQISYFIGIKGGTVFSQYIISDEYSGDGTNSRILPAIGFTSQLFKSEYFMLMPEFYFLQRGMGGYGYISDRTSPVTYLSCLLLPAFRIENKLINAFFLAGSRIEFNLNYNKADFLDFNHINKVNFGFTLGTGLEKEISRKICATAEFRYSRDITPFAQSETVGGTILHYANSSFDALIGINYKLGK